MPWTSSSNEWGRGVLTYIMICLYVIQYFYVNYSTINNFIQKGFTGYYFSFMKLSFFRLGPK